MPINGATKLYGLAGKPVEHSLSPAIHNFLFQRFGINGVYVAFPVEPEDFSTLLRGVSKTGLFGLNITTPHKVRACKVLTSLGATAKAVGAANTLVRKPRGWHGVNTDGQGFCDWVEQEASFPLKGARVVLLGAGPAARAVLCELAERKAASVAVLNRSTDKYRKSFFRQMKKRGVLLEQKDSAKAKELLQEAHIIINGTSWGLGGKSKGKSPWKVEKCKPEIVVDCNYHVSGKTPFIELFGKKIKKFDGQGMLRWQAALAFTLWTGRKVTNNDHRALKQHLDKLDRP